MLLLIILRLRSQPMFAAKKKSIVYFTHSKKKSKKVLAHYKFGFGAILLVLFWITAGGERRRDRKLWGRIAFKVLFESFSGNNISICNLEF